MKRAPKQEKHDPLFSLTPWEIIYDDEKRVIGEVYKPPTEYLIDGLWRGVKRNARIKDLS